MRFEARPNGALWVRAPAKINLHLEVGPPRADGFHEIDSLFAAVSLFDELELRLTDTDSITLIEEGIACGEDNLVHRAAVALARIAFARRPPRGVEITLRKRIPYGAGLGGGSSDAAATLIALVRLWEVEITRAELVDVAAGLGSDVPFFLWGGVAICRGRGEKVVPLPDRVFEAPLSIVLVLPGISVPTRDVYRALDAAGEHGTVLTGSSPLDSLTSANSPCRLTEGALVFNRLERPACRVFPALERIRQRMRTEPFDCVWMTGSGSTFCGLTQTPRSAHDAADRLREAFASDVELAVVETLPGWSFAWLKDGR